MPLPWPVQGIDTTPDGRGAIVNGLTGTMLVDLTTAAVIWGPVPHDSMDDRDATRTAAVSPDGLTAAVGTPGGIRTMDITTGMELANTNLPDGDQIASVAFSADSSTIIVGSYGGYTYFLATADLQPRTPRRLTTGGWVLDLAVDPDGRYLASIGTDGDLLLWDTATWRPLGQPISDRTGWGWLSFDPDGRTLRAVHQTGKVLAFTTDPDSWLRTACRIANRDLTEDESAVIRPNQVPRSTCQDYR